LRKQQPLADVEHFLRPHNQTLHLLSESVDSDLITAFVDHAQTITGLHVATIDGSQLDSANQLAGELEEIYRFPYRGYGDYKDGVHWDGFSDWLNDLTWFTNADPPNPIGIKSFILFYLNPSRLFKTEPVESAFFLDVWCRAAQEHLHNGIAFHLVIGPIDKPIVPFIHILKAADYLCNDWDYA
jgi:hypothetical protein